MWCGRSVRRCGEMTSSLAGRAAAVMTEAGTEAGWPWARRRLRLLLPLLLLIVDVDEAVVAPAAVLGRAPELPAPDCCSSELALTPMVLVSIYVSAIKS